MIQNMREKHSKRSEYIAKMKETDREREMETKKLDLLGRNGKNK